MIFFKSINNIRNFIWAVSFDYVNLETDERMKVDDELSKLVDKLRLANAKLNMYDSIINKDEHLQNLVDKYDEE